VSRFHIHIAVEDLDRSVAFYSAVFGQEPTTLKTDYAKWALDDPRLNFALSTRGAKPGVDHLGLQAENPRELAALRRRLDAAGIQGLAQDGTTCCYAQSDKYWVQDPQGIGWESFHTLGSAPVYGASRETVDEGACCVPIRSDCCG